MKKKTNDRLLKLARQLGSIALKEYLTGKKPCYNSKCGNNNIECFYWVFEEFPKIFPEWRYDEKSTPFLKGKAELNSFTAASYFLELDVDALFHLFVPGYQMPSLFLGNELHPESTPGQLSDNLYDFLIAMEKGSVPITQLVGTKTKSLTNLNNNNHEKDENYMSGLCA